MVPFPVNWPIPGKTISSELNCVPSGAARRLVVSFWIEVVPLPGLTPVKAESAESFDPRSKPASTALKTSYISRGDELVHRPGGVEICVGRALLERSAARQDDAGGGQNGLYVLDRHVLSIQLHVDASGIALGLEGSSQIERPHCRSSRRLDSRCPRCAADHKSESKSTLMGVPAGEPPFTI